MPKAFWFVLGVALLTRVGALGFVWPLQVSFDSGIYHLQAQSLLAGDGLRDSAIAPGAASGIHPPGFAAFLTAVYFFLGDSQRVGQATGIPLGVITVALIGLITWQLFRNRTAAMLATAIAAVYPPLILLSVTLVSESLFMPLALGAVAAALHYRQVGSMRWLALVGVLAGLSMLVRLIGAVLLLILVLLVWRPQPRLLSLRALAAPALLAAIGIAVFSPWSIRNSTAMDTFVPLGTQSGINWAGTYNPEAHADPRHEWISPEELDIYAPFYERAIERAVRGEPMTEIEFFNEIGDAGKDYLKDHPTLALATGFEVVKRTLEVDFRSMTWFETELTGIGGNEAGTQRVRVFAWLNAIAFLTVLALALVAVVRGYWRKVPWPVLVFPFAMVVPMILIASGLRYRVPGDFVVIGLAAITLAQTEIAQRLEARGWLR